MKKTIALLVTAAFAAFGSSSFAADSATPAPGAEISKDQAGKMKTTSEAEYKAKGKVAEANEDLNKADCKNSLDGAAKRACEKSAKMQAKSEKADAKTVHEQEKKAISNAAKPAN
jgi:hypothetical protein